MSARDARTFAVGDLLEQVTLLRDLLEELQLTPNDTLVLLGDLGDCGEDSVATSSLVASLADRCHLVLIQGNHDQAWLEVWPGGGYSGRPNITGGRVIWEQYQGRPPLLIGQVLSTTVLTYEDSFAFYSHAGATVGKPFAEAWPESWVWGESDFLDDHP